jgi:hypothetical protein
MAKPAKLPTTPPATAAVWLFDGFGVPVYVDVEELELEVSDELIGVEAVGEVAVGGVELVPMKLPFADTELLAAALLPKELVYRIVVSMSSART